MFPGATASTETNGSYTIIGAPLERSVSFIPGTRFGPRTIRHYATGFEDYDHRTGQHFTDLAVTDAGDLHAWNDAAEYLDFLTKEVQDVVETGALPLLLGGEHTVTTAGVRATAPSLLVCIDAHLDLREQFDGDRWSHSTVMHHVKEDVEEIVIIGARAGAAAEWDLVDEQQSITTIGPAASPDWIEESLQSVISDHAVYLSIDIDGIDPGFAPATGTREPFGLSPPTVRRIIDSVAPSTVGFDIVEVSDTDSGQTATLAAKLLREFVFQHATHHAP